VAAAVCEQVWLLHQRLAEERKLLRAATATLVRLLIAAAAASVMGVYACVVCSARHMHYNR